MPARSACSAACHIVPESGWADLLFPSPCHGVLAVKGFIRVAFSRLAPASPPDCLRCAVPGRFRAISPELPEHRHVERHFLR